MIRTIPIPRSAGTRIGRLGRLGVVGMGAGGNAGSYRFDPATGLSNDPQLAYYLQDLTPAQLQTALDGGSPNPDLISLLEQDLSGTGAGWLPCGTAATPACGPATPNGLASIPVWAWVLLGTAVVLLAIGGSRR